MDRARGRSRSRRELRNANANWAALKRGENVEKRTITSERKAGATHSGLNLENELRRRIGVLAEPEVRGGFNGASRQHFRNLPRAHTAATPGAGPRNWSAVVAVWVPSRELAVSVVSGPANTSASILQLVTGATLLLGLGAAKYSNMAAMQRARELQLMLLARSPYAQAAGGCRAHGPVRHKLWLRRRS